MLGRLIERGVFSFTISMYFQIGKDIVTLSPDVSVTECKTTEQSL